MQILAAPPNRACIAHSRSFGLMSRSRRKNRLTAISTKTTASADTPKDGAHTQRRELLLGGLLVSGSFIVPSSKAKAVELAAVTPPIAAAGNLSASEQAVIKVFDANTTAVVNVFDISLIGRAPLSNDVETPEGNGTGFVWDKEGHIVTNYHVLGNVLKGLGDSANGKRVAKISLLGSDGLQQSYDGILVGSDKRRDLAIVKINAPQVLLTPVSVGNSQTLRVGQLCLAIGNPFGFDHTLTTGAISGLGRDIQSQLGSIIGGGIQTDAAINPGNSGGPLLDSHGDVIGVNTAIFTNSGTSAGIGFAIPIDTVKRVVPQIIEYGRVVQPSLKLQVAPERVAQALNVKNGVLIQSVEPGSPAERAGLLPTRRGLSGVVAGDVITSINGRPIKTSGEYQVAVDNSSVGDEVTVEVSREGKPMTFKVKLEAA
mmetsp:Transcript_16801/g.46940  ORF Transcript_16801/g.46940 Transcript_16801/m.46940 type:complete len:428 (-) Transcript_16801:2381-3664(-)